MSDPIDELLDDALAEICNARSGESVLAAHTRERVLASTKKRRRRYDTLLAAAAVLCVFFVTPTVWAHVSGRLPGILESLGLREPASRPVPVRRPAAQSSVSEVAPVLQDPPLQQEETSPVAEGMEPVPEVAPIAPPRRRPALVAPTLDERDLAEEAADSSQNVERELFSHAHQAHFGGESVEQALAGWNTYLERYPNGAFVPEASYNRAVSLIRLGRLEAAKRALSPFARGVFGTTRQLEAELLLEAIEERSQNAP